MSVRIFDMKYTKRFYEPHRTYFYLLKRFYFPLEMEETFMCLKINKQTKKRLTWEVWNKGFFPVKRQKYLWTIPFHLFPWEALWISNLWKMAQKRVSWNTFLWKYHWKITRKIVLFKILLHFSETIWLIKYL